MKKLLKGFGFIIIAVGVLCVMSGIAVAKTLTVGVSWSNFQEERWKTDEAAMKAQLEKLGAKFVELSLPHLDYGIAAYYIIAPSEASSNLARYDGVKYGHRSDKFDDMIDMYCRSRAEGFGDEVKRRIMLGTYALSSGLTPFDAVC